MAKINFNPRAPRGARRYPRHEGGGRTFYFNPRAPRGARLCSTALIPRPKKISIHVPREGHDRPAWCKRRNCKYFNPRAPRGARLPQVELGAKRVLKFQSTCPARGTTLSSGSCARQAIFQSTCPARGTTSRSASSRTPYIFQSTCPARGTTVRAEVLRLDHGFQSTCPARGTTVAWENSSVVAGISIHVPREGHDLRLDHGECRECRISIHVPREGHDSWTWRDTARGLQHFNPRAPRGARLQPYQFGHPYTKFQSTCPARGTTKSKQRNTPTASHFNPRAPRGARHVGAPNSAKGNGISIHVPREGHDYGR